MWQFFTERSKHVIQIAHREALRLLLTVRDDERALNALGVAYWLCGQQQEAIECFRRAAANGNVDAEENLRQLEKNNQ